MTAKPSPFIWYDIVTTDAEAATHFYEAVAGLDYHPGPPSPKGEYRYATSPGNIGVGGCIELDATAQAEGARPAWVGYIYVPDVDAAITAMEADGARVMMPAFDVPGAGRIALIADPWGAPLHIMTPQSGGEGESQAFQPQPTPGHIGWNELATPDPEAAIAFYTKHFGWNWPEPMDMGPMGKYHFLQFTGGSADCPEGATANGALFRKPPEMPVSLWIYYIWADDIDAALARAQGAGAKLLMGPHEVPGGLWIFQALDPQGALFAMVGQRTGDPL